jgi:hypothetical protein
MITCPVCQQRELEGEFFCSNCGARLESNWADVTATTSFVAAPLPREMPRAAPAAFDPLEPGQIALSLTGIGQPIILSGRAQYILGREGQEQVTPDLNLNAYGHYHETYEKTDGQWRIKSSKLTRLRQDVFNPVFSLRISERMKNAAAKMARR